MNIASANDRDDFLESLAAELTNAAYPVVLRHGVGEKWLELQLDLWKAMIESVHKLDCCEVQTPPSVTNPSKLSELFG